jgi:type IV fimbrial biogenesis protein FimT
MESRCITTPPCASRAGFTLIELMVAVSVLAILVMVSAGPLRDFVMNTRLTGQANELMTDLMLARSEASKRSVRVSVCAKRAVQNDKGVPADTCATDWTGGWIVVIDGDSNGLPDTGTSPLKVADAVTGANSLQKITGGAGPITFTPTGLVATSATTLLLCDNRDKGRAVRVAVTGRTSVTKLDGSCAATKQ